MGSIPQVEGSQLRAMASKNCWLNRARRIMLRVGRSPMGERLKELIYETAVVTGGMAPIALLALALLS